MADSRLEEIFGRSINSAKELKKGIIDLQNSMKDLGTDQDALTKRSKELTYAQEEYNKMVNSAKQATDFAKDSILGMEKEYKNLYNTYKMLTEEQRNSDFGKNMAESLDQLSNKLNDSKKEVGNYKDNIGRYTQGVMDAFSQMGISIGALQGPMKLAAGGARTLGAALKSFIANPVGAIIMAIVLAFKAMKAVVDQVKEAINNNEESQMRLKEAMSAFQPIIDGVKNAFDVLGKVVVSVVEWIGKAVETVRKAIAAFTDFIGITNGAEAAVTAQIEAYKGLAKAQNDYIKKQREVKVANAKDTAKVEELREEAAETENVEEKIKLLTEAKNIQAEIDKRNLELAEENLRILKEEASHTANNAEANDKLADAMAAVEQARAQANRNARQFTKSIKSATDASKGHKDVLKQEREEVQKIIETLAENNKTEIQKLTEKYEKEKTLLIKYHKDTTELTKQYNANLEKLNAEAAKLEEEKREAAFQKQVSDTKAFDDAILAVMATESSVNAMVAEAKIVRERLNILRKWEAEIEKSAEKIRQNEPDLFDAEIFDPELDERFEAVYKQISRANADWLDGEITNFKEFETALAKTQNEYVNKASKAMEAWAANEISLATYNIKVAEASNPYTNGTLEYFQVQKDLEDALLEAKLEIKQEELRTYQGTEEQKLAIKTEIIEIENEMIEKQAQRQRELSSLNLSRNNQLYDSTMSNVDAINNLLGGIKSLTKAEIDSGKLSQKQIEKKQKALKALEIVQGAVAAASVVADTAAGIMGIWRGYALEKVANAETAAATGPAAAATLTALNTKSLISAILQTTAMGINGTAQLASISSGVISNVNNMSDSDGGTSAAATPSVNIDSTPYSYTRTLQTEEEEEMMNRPYYVSVTDINEVQNRVTVREEEATF